MNASSENLAVLAQELGFITKTGGGAFYKKNDDIQALLSFGSGMFVVSVGRPGLGSDKTIYAKTDEEVKIVVEQIGLA